MIRRAWFLGCFFAGSVAAVGACRSGAAPETPNGGEPAGGGSPLAIASGSANTGGEAPHVFTPRAHPRRVHTAPPAPPPLAALPRMVNRMGQCFGAAVDESSGGYGYGGGGIGQGSGYGAGRGALRSSAGGSTSSTKGRAPLPAGPPPAAARPSPATAAAPAADRAESSPQKVRAEKKAEAEAPAEIARRDEGAADDEAPRGYHDWGSSIYLSNDDTMSLSSAQRVMFAIDKFLPLPAEHIRPHELLNYFSFDEAPVAPGNDFSVAANLEPDPSKPGQYTLALSVAGRSLGKEGRRNGNLALVVDRSGSMQAEGRMEYLKRGLRRMVSELKNGDIVSLVLFDHEVCTPVENFVVGRDPSSLLSQAIDRIEPRGSTDVYSGLNAGYDIADRAYQPTYTNRLILVTDALANTGVTDERWIAMVGRYYDSRRIRLSGVGVGTEFNDSLLDRLTERGRGAYVFLGSEAEVDAVFGSRFVSLIETTADDVHFRLHLPPSLRMNVFYGEESSTVKADVQAVHYFADTSQLFLSDLVARGGNLRPDDSIMLTVEYEHPETNQEMFEEYAYRIGDITGPSRNVQKGRLVMRFVDGLGAIAARPAPSRWRHAPESWEDEEGFAQCDAGRTDLQSMASSVKEDPEVRRVLGLWEKFCSRYERPRNPVRRPLAGQPDRWPGAQD